MARIRSIGILFFITIVAFPFAKADAAAQCPIDIIEDAAGTVQACNLRLADPALSSEERARALIVRGRAHHVLGQSDAAALDYENAIVVAPHPAEAHVWRGWLAYNQNDLPLAMDHVRGAFASTPDFPRAYDLLGAIRRAVGDFRGAHEAYAKAIAGWPENGQFHYHRYALLAAFLHQREALEESDVILRLPASELDMPSRIALWGKNVSLRVAIGVERGTLLDAMGRFEEAAAAYDEVVERAPSALTYGMRAGFSFSRNVPLDVIQGDIDKALTLDPDYWLGHDQQAHMYWRTKQPEAALAEYTKAVDLRPNDGLLRWFRAMVLRELGRLDEATAEALTAVDVDTNLLRRKAGILFRLGYLSAVPAAGDPRPAIHDAVRACMLDKRCS